MDDEQSMTRIPPSRAPWARTMAGIALAASLALTIVGCQQADTTAPAAAAPAITADATAAPAAGASTAVTETAADSDTAPAEPAAVATAPKLNLNEATLEQFLAAIPDLGNRMVREFQEYRPYVSIQQFRREIGKYVDTNQIAFYEQYVYVPVAPNDSDAETLQQLPGVDATVAESLIAARPYASNDAFLEKLGSLVGADNLSAAAAFLAVQ